MFEVSVTGWFAAAHRLRLADGTTESPHGHNWKAVATFAGPELDDSGMLLEFAKIKPRLDELLATLHHRNLNELSAFARCNPSAENVASYIADWLGQDLPQRVRLVCVEIEEAPGCIVRYRPESGRSAGR
jgi:6-pyruvoyltetrahydropterin/6-carboxytetrahydropterin synthase